MSNTPNLPREPSAAARGEWVLLIQQLPPGASNGRVKTWRRLQNLGAISLRNAVYVLPNSAQAREDFAWLRKEILDLGGQATVMTADPVDDEERAAVVELFRSTRTADFDAVGTEVEQLARRAPGLPPRQLQQATAVLRERLTAIQNVDFFGAPRGREVRQALAGLEERMSRKSGREPQRALPLARKQAFQNRTWVTRTSPGVDRMASAWLIKRFIDPRARFAFAAADHRPTAAQVPFDMFEGDFSHQGDRCTFEVLAGRFRLDDAALSHIGEVVHDLDLKDRRYNRQETNMIGALVEGIASAAQDDADALRQGATIFEGLYQSIKAAEKNQPPRSTAHATTKARKRT